MSETREAWCAGKRVQVSGRAAPPDHRQVACLVCGVKRGLDCVAIGSNGELLYAGHVARQRSAALLRAAMST